jgi:uncharacterized membrane protein (DUF485 family)
MAELPAEPDGKAVAAADTVAAHLAPEQRERLVRAMMRRQASLGAGVAVIFLALIFGLPLVNWLGPQAANAPAPGGFTWTWLFLGILFYPITMLLSAYFVRASERVEADLVVEGRRMLDEGRADR